jgi:hypothetical protein
MAVSNSGASLTAQTSAAAGTAITFTSVCKRHGMAVQVATFTGTGGALVRLELSMDNSNWFPAPGGGSVRVTGTGTYYVASLQDYPALYARANLLTIDASVSSISLGAILASE